MHPQGQWEDGTAAKALGNRVARGADVGSGHRSIGNSSNPTLCLCIPTVRHLTEGGHWWGNHRSVAFAPAIIRRHLASSWQTRRQQIAKAKEAIAETLGEQEETEFKNLLAAQAIKSLKSYCYGCYGTLKHDDPLYYLKNAGEHAKLSSEWLNLRKRIYGRSQGCEQAVVDHLFDKAMKSANAEQAVCLEKAQKCNLILLPEWELDTIEIFQSNTIDITLNSTLGLLQSPFTPGCNFLAVVSKAHLAPPFSEPLCEGLHDHM